MANTSLCANCSAGIWCGTWAQWKCTAQTRRVYETVTKCDDYKKRGKDFKESRCQCDDCLRNEALTEELEEESEV